MEKKSVDIGLEKVPSTMLVLIIVTTEAVFHPTSAPRDVENQLRDGKLHYDEYSTFDAPHKHITILIIMYRRIVLGSSTR